MLVSWSVVSWSVVSSIRRVVTALTLVLLAFLGIEVALFLLAAAFLY